MTDFSDQTVARFLEELASSAPTPGGGTAAAVAGAMGASLAEMVTALTLAREKYAPAHGAMREIAKRAAAAREELLLLSREDSEAYDEVVAARRLPKGTDSEKAAREQKLARANLRATEVPLRTARAAAGLLEGLPELAEKGNPNAASDAGTAATLLEAAVQGALLNVAINLPGIPDPAVAEEIRREAETLQVDAGRLRDRVLGLVRSHI
jgi:formiminotetrahydrofolate cyclodeaminase